MDGLIGLRAISLCGLAGAEESEEGVGRLLLHDLADSEFSVAKAEAALQWVMWVLLTVAGKVDNGSASKQAQHLMYRSCDAVFLSRGLAR
jgi:hypothetical protein